MNEGNACNVLCGNAILTSWVRTGHGNKEFAHTDKKLGEL